MRTTILFLALFAGVVNAVTNSVAPVTIDIPVVSAVAPVAFVTSKVAPVASVAISTTAVARLAPVLHDPMLYVLPEKPETPLWNLHRDAMAALKAGDTNRYTALTNLYWRGVGITTTKPSK